MIDTATAPLEGASDEDRWATAADREEAARETYRQVLAAGEKLTDDQLGALYGRSGRWGRYRIAEVTRGRTSGAERASTVGQGSGGGNGPGSQCGQPDLAGGSHRSGDGSRNGSHPAVNGQDRAAVAWPVVGTDGNRTTAGDHERHDAAAWQVEADTKPPAGPTATDPVTETSALEPTGAPAPAEEVPAWVGWLTMASILLVVLAAAVASVDHLADAARLADVGGWKVWLLPAAVDGLASGAALALYRAHKLRERTGGVAWLALVLGVMASVAGNIIAVHPELVDTDTLKVAVGATPPLSLALALHLALAQVRRGAFPARGAHF